MHLTGAFYFMSLKNSCAYKGWTDNLMDREKRKGYNVDLNISKGGVRGENQSGLGGCDYDPQQAEQTRNQFM